MDYGLLANVHYVDRGMGHLPFPRTRELEIASFCQTLYNYLMIVLNDSDSAHEISQQWRERFNLSR